MGQHEWSSSGFVHSAPGAADCWDQRVRCPRCGTKAVLINQVESNAVKARTYDRMVGTATGKERVAAIRELKDGDKVPSDCDQLIVNAVHRR